MRTESQQIPVELDIFFQNTEQILVKSIETDARAWLPCAAIKQGQGKTWYVPQGMAIAKGLIR